MSRLETNAEPSMEEILASIRKIIAEEPPGSRATPPVPASRTASSSAPASSSPKRGFMTREAFMRSPAPAEPQKPGAAVEPTKPDASKAKSDTASVASSAQGEQGRADGAVHSAKSNGHDKAAAASAVEPAEELKPEIAAPASRLKHAPDAETEVKSKASSDPRARSIDAQLADLLGDDLQALNGAEHSPSGAGGMDIKGDAAKTNGAAASEMRAGFAASRDGHANGASETDDNGDPFSFDLGPSPFSSRSESSSRETRKASPGAPTSEASPAIESKPNGDSRHGGAEARERHASTTDARAPEPVPSAARPAPSNEPFAVPSVAATLGPHRTLEPLSAAFQPSPFEHPAFEHRANGAIPSSPPRLEQPRGASVRAEFRGERLERVLQPAITDENRQDMTMEDAVADLLRPLLRTWLAENMPKIIERALRREMTERLLPGQKGPFD